MLPLKRNLRMMQIILTGGTYAQPARCSNGVIFTHLCSPFYKYIYMKLATKFIHAGMEPDPSTGAIMTPIYQTSTYVQAAPGKHKGYEYARSQNPTRKALEDAFAVLENAKFGLSFSSGVAATDAVIKLLNPGDEVIASNDLYG